MKGKIIIISAPSGAGKSSVIKALRATDLNVGFSVSACTRKMREGEVDGKDYYFLSVEEFKKRIEKNEFIEWEEVYKDHYYGTLKSELQRIWNKGQHVLIEADVYGGMNIKKKYGEAALSIFIIPPSIEDLRKRLVKRSTDNKESIDFRLAKAEEEISLKHHFDRIIVNDNLEDAIRETSETIFSFLEN